MAKAEPLTMSGEPKEVLKLVRGVAKHRLPPYFALARWLVDQKLDYGCTMYTTGDWVARGESVGNKALFTVTFEGNDMYSVINGHYEGLEGRRFAKKVYEGLTDFLEKRGLGWEQGMTWSLHVYRD
jgi:hypothetical protein